MNIKYFYTLFLVIILILGFSFYWYSYRPEQIRKNCYQGALQIELQIAGSGDFDGLYKACLREYGF